jgi:hypothetical protein
MCQSKRSDDEALLAKILGAELFDLPFGALLRSGGAAAGDAPIERLRSIDSSVFFPR